MKKLTKILLLILLLSALRYPLSANAAVPHLLNYQGKLTDSAGVPLNGSYSITFRIYDSETAGTLLWEEVQSGVVITKGVFSTLLGSVTALNLAFDKSYYLEIKVGSEVMSPRQRLSSAAYAIRAEEANTINGILPIAKGGTGQSTAQYCNLVSNVIGVLPVSNGGTGISSSLSKSGSYTGNGTTQYIPHSLGGKPNLVILINTNNAELGVWLTGCPGLYRTFNASFSTPFDVDENNIIFSSNNNQFNNNGQTVKFYVARSN